MLEVEGLGLIVFLLLPVAAATGWFIGRRDNKSREDDASTLNSSYLQGLNYLVNEDPDKAIEVFVRMIEIDNETVETHLALGNLFRRRGEVDRALRIHQNLVARPNLSPRHRNQARLELAQDYLKAGVLDRAEALFKELADQGLFLETTLGNLASIYEKERDWKPALEVVRRLETARGRTMRPTLAQYQCEIAEQANRNNDRRAALVHAKRALSEDRGCVRANMTLGRLYADAEQWKSAIKSYRKALKQDIAFTPEILPQLAKCYASLKASDGWSKLLLQLNDEYEGAAPIIELARWQQENGGNATETLASYLEERTSWIGFYHLLDLAWSDPNVGLSGPLDSLREALRQLIDSSPRYQCNNCGFGGRTLHWQCPNCSQWNSTAPLTDVIHAPTTSIMVSPLAGQTA